MRHSEPRSGFVPDNKPAEGEWYWIDAPGIAQSLQLPPDTPLVEVGGCCCCWLTALWSAAMVLDTVFIEGKPHIQEQYRASSCHLSLHNLLAAALFRPLSTSHMATGCLQVVSPSSSHEALPSAMDVLALRTQKPVTKQEQYPSPRGVQDLMGFSVNPDDHRNYALTWYTLAAATALLANRAMRQRPVIVKRHR